MRNALIPILLFFSVIGCLYLHFGDLVLLPNHYMLDGTSDGLKNYYTPSYYVQNDKGWRFSGMNYPFGEHVVYTDNQPLISGVLNLFDNYFFSIENNTVGIINSLMFLGLWLCAWFLFLILHRKLHLPQFYSLVFSLLITFLSPQIARMAGHYGLAYCCFIPMLWYYLITFQQSKNMLPGTLSLLAICICFSFIHLYYLLIGALFLLAYWLVFAFENRKAFSNIKKRSAFLLIAAIVPLVVVRLVISLSDPVIDRPAAPFGITFYRAFLETVFLPVYGPVQELFQQVIPYTTVRREGHAYVGFIGLLVALFTIFRLLKKVFKGDRRFRLTQVRWLNQSLKAAVLTLLFSLGIPFIWGMEFLLEILPPLKQFRSLGRFAWIFYYVFTVFTAYTIYLWFRTFTIKNKPVFTIGLLVIAIGIYAVESHIHLRETKSQFNPVENYLSNASNDLLKTIENQGYVPNEFQAILSLPYFHIGSEKLTIHRDGKAFESAVKVSSKTGLPMIQVQMSRTSNSQTAQLVQLLSDSLIPKEIISQLPNQKPLLLVVTNRIYDTYEKQLIRKAKPIYESNEFSLLELPLSAFTTTLSNEPLVYGYQKPVYWNSFEKSTRLHRLSGTGSFFKKDGKVELLSWEFPDETSFMELSFWIYLEPSVYGLPEVEIQHLKNKKVISKMKVEPQHLTNIYKNWLMVTAEFKVKPEFDQLKIQLDGNSYWIDDLMIRRKNVDTYVKIDKTLKKNNYTISE